MRQKGDLAEALSYFDQYLPKASHPDPQAVVQINRLRAMLE
jgi:hypothetical protein